MQSVASRGLAFHRAFVCLVTFLAAAPAVAAEKIQAGFQERVYRDETGNHRYTVFVPAEYTPDREWPVILYLHGASGRGTDNASQLESGLAPQIRARAGSFPFLVVFPQSEDMSSRLLYGWQADTADGKRALRILDDVEREFRVDRRREILTGWSMGGYGTWSLAAQQPARWSALLIIAGGGDVETAQKLKAVPIWAIHGIDDPGSPIATERRMVAAARAAGNYHLHFTELSEVRHNIGHVVYGEDAIYDWMLHPLAPPRTDDLIHGSRRPPTQSETTDRSRPFVPAFEIPQAVFVHLDKTALEALGFAAPGMVPPEAIAGVAPDMHETRRGLLTRFDIGVSGINYRGTLEQMRVKTRNDGWVTIELGLRDMTMELGATQINGRLISATAGPMQIVIGHQSPVWLTIEARPKIVDRHLRFELGAVRLPISEGNYYVTQPQVTTRGLPLLRNRVSEAVSANMVQTAYKKKSEIESQVIAAVPGLFRRIEELADQKMSQPIGFSSWPNPSNEPRFQLWPDRLQVDESGLSLFVGMTVACRTDAGAKSVPIRRIDRPFVKFEDLPRRGGMSIGVSGAVFEGMTAAAVDAGIAHVDVRDLLVPEFAALSDMRQLRQAIPDLARYGDRLQVRTLLRACAPIDIEGPQSLAPISPAKARANGLNSRRGTSDKMSVAMHGLRLCVEIKTSPDEPKWMPCAEFDVRLRQQLQLQMRSPSFEARSISLIWPDTTKVEIKGRFAEGYSPRDHRLESAVVANLFEQGWLAAEKLEPLQHLPAADHVIGTARLRLAEVGWHEPFLFKRFVPAQTRITNASKKPVVYTARGPNSDWGGPFTLQPGESHDFPVPYSLVVRPLTPAGTAASAVPMGSHFLFKPDSAASASTDLGNTTSTEGPSTRTRNRTGDHQTSATHREGRI